MQGLVTGDQLITHRLRRADLLQKRVEIRLKNHHGPHGPRRRALPRSEAKGIADTSHHAPSRNQTRKESIDRALRAVDR